MSKLPWAYRCGDGGCQIRHAVLRQPIQVLQHKLGQVVGVGGAERDLEGHRRCGHAPQRAVHTRIRTGIRRHESMRTCNTVRHTCAWTHWHQPTC